MSGCSEEEDTHKFFTLIGKTVDSKPIQNFISEETSTVADTSMYDDTYYLNYYLDGLSLLFNKQDELMNIQVYSEGANEFHGYTGDLPYDIQFTDDMETLRNKFGEEDGSFALRDDDFIKTGWKSEGVAANMYTSPHKGNFIKVLIFHSPEEKED